MEVKQKAVTVLDEIEITTTSTTTATGREGPLNKKFDVQTEKESALSVKTISQELVIAVEMTEATLPKSVTENPVTNGLEHSSPMIEQLQLNEPDWEKRLTKERKRQSSEKESTRESTERSSMTRGFASSISRGNSWDNLKSTVIVNVSKHKTENENNPAEQISSSSDGSKDVKNNTNLKTPKAISTGANDRLSLKTIEASKTDDLRSSSPPPTPGITFSQNFSNVKNPIFTIFRLPGSANQNSGQRSGDETDLGKIFSLVARSAAAGVQAAAKASLLERSG